MKKIYTLPEVENMLTCRGEEENRLYLEAKNTKNATVGENVYLRGLIEISNIFVPKTVITVVSENLTQKQPDIRFQAKKSLKQRTLPTSIISVPSYCREENVPIKNCGSYHPFVARNQKEQ